MTSTTPRAVAEELDMEIQALMREMTQALTYNPVSDPTRLAVKREFRTQIASAARLRALFAPQKRAA